ncbi:MAG: hypothetical protein Q7U73_20150 [Rubrivivax sp.]|nr:hypothetical protein [Rubrivivax sp.]
MPAATTPTRCRHCGATLSELARRGGRWHCGLSACLHKEEQARISALKARAATQALQDAAGLLPPGQPAARTVVWLEPCSSALVPVSDDDRARHAAHLRQVVAEGVAIDRSKLAEASADDSHPQSGQLCGHCGGRCCQHGVAWNAFIDITVLQQWVDDHAGRTLDDAAHAYVDALPDAHVHGACLYQTARGCALPRERRAWICNGFACPALQQVQAEARRDPLASVVALTMHQGHVARAAVVTADATLAFELRPAAPLT